MPLSNNGLAVTVVVFCFFLDLLARGVSETYAVFLLPLGDEFKWSRAQLTSVYSVFMLSHGLAAPFTGLLFDRLGPRFIYCLGLFCYGCGYLLAGQLEQLWQFYLCVGVLGGIGVAAIGIIPASALVSRWYKARLTTAMGIVYSGLGFGVLVIVPLTQVLIDTNGWRFSYTVLGILLLLTIPLVLIMPWQRIALGHPDYSRSTTSDGVDHSESTFIQALKTPAFWTLFGMFFFTSISMFIVSLQIVAYLVEIGFEPLLAASAFGFVGMLSILGMVCMAWLADRFGRRLILTISYSFSIIGILLLYLLSFIPTYSLLITFVLFFGIVQGSRGPVAFSIGAQLFAGSSLGTIYGALTLGMGIGAALGSWLAGILYDLSGDYMAAFAVSVVAACCALSLFWFVPVLARERPGT